MWMNTRARQRPGNRMTTPAPTWLALFAATALALLLAACGSGGLSWRFEVGRHAAWSPIAMGGVLYVGSEVGEIHALDSETGRLLWSHAVGIRYYVPASAYHSRGCLLLQCGRP